MENKKEDQAIYLKDLLFAAVHRWRTVLIIAVVAAILLGGFNAIRNLGSAASDAQYQAAMEQYALDKEALSAKAELLQDHIESCQDYLENSILVKINPYGFYQACLVLYTDTNYQINPGTSYQDIDKTAGVLVAYEAAFTGDTMVNLLAESIKTQPQYISELITCRTSLPQGTISVGINCTSKEDAQLLLDKLSQQLSALQSEINLSVANHTVSILDQSVVRKVDPTIATKQSESTERLSTLMDDLSKTEVQLSAIVSPSKPSVLKSTVIFSVLGGVLGAFLSVCVIWFMHITSDKVYAARVLGNRTGVKVLGCLAEAKKCALDRWLNKLEGRSTVDPQVQAAWLATNIRNYCAKTEHLLVVGCANPDQLKTFSQALQEAMPGTQITFAANLLNNATALDALAVCDTVVLAEQCNVSRYSQINKQVALINDYNKELIGCILLGG